MIRLLDDNNASIYMIQHTHPVSALILLPFAERYQRYFRARVDKLWTSPPSPVPRARIYCLVRCPAVINIAIAQVQFSGSSADTWYQTLVLNRAWALSPEPTWRSLSPLYVYTYMLSVTCSFKYLQSSTFCTWCFAKPFGWHLQLKLLLKNRNQRRAAKSVQRFEAKLLRMPQQYSY